MGREARLKAVSVLLIAAMMIRGNGPAMKVDHSVGSVGHGAEDGSRAIEMNLHMDNSCLGFRRYCSVLGEVLNPEEEGSI